MAGLIHVARPPFCSTVRQPLASSSCRACLLPVPARAVRLGCRFRAVHATALPLQPLTETSTADNGSNGARGPAVVPAPAPPPVTLPPPAIFQQVARLGADKAKLSLPKLVVLGLLAGIYIGFGGLLMASVGGVCPQLAAADPGLHKAVLGIFGLPVGLFIVTMCGAELFTGNTAVVTAAVLDGRASWRALARNWAVCYVTNFIGCLALVAAVMAAGVLGPTSAPVGIAVAKTSLTFSQAFVRGIMANWMVCIAVWHATAASSVSGKVLGIWIPITAFVCVGLEHSVANMFLVPMGIALGAPVTFSQFLMRNLLPVTLGNIIGGAVLVASSYAFLFSTREAREKAASSVILTP